MSAQATEEDADTFSGVSTTASLHDLLLAPEEKADFATVYKNYKSEFMQSVNDLLEELEERCGSSSFPLT